LEKLTVTEFSGRIAERIRAEHVSLAARWLDRLRLLIPVEEAEVFPSEELLDHIPLLIQEIAGYLAAPETEAVSANTAVIAKAQELGRLRHQQRASVHQLLAEYRILDGILCHFVQDEVSRSESEAPGEQVAQVLRRLNEALWILTQTTVDTFVAEYMDTIAGHAARLDSFNRMVSHELRQPLSALLYSLPLVKSSLDGNDRAGRFLGVMERNVHKLIQLMEQLEVLSRLRASPTTTPAEQQMDVTALAREVARQLREMADERQVEIRVSDALPSIDVDIARLELVLMNLVSNAIKYSDPAKPHRFVAVEAGSAAEADMVAIIVRDNGLGIPADAVSAVFDRFVRAHAERDGELRVRGSGLGLAIAQECAEAVGGRIAVESELGAGTTFSLFLPIAPVPRRA
jgi:signal transduction histidine kinase